jgi:hypothetical protein
VTRPLAMRITPEQADWLQRTIDGALDAGACEGGLEPDEREALQAVEAKLMKYLVTVGRRGKRRA